MSTLNHTKLSETFELFDLDLVSVPSQGQSSLCSIQKSIEKTVDVINTGQISGLVYWFEIRLDENNCLCTLDTRYHWKQAGVIIKGDHMVISKEKVTARITLQNSCLDVLVIK